MDSLEELRDLYLSKRDAMPRAERRRWQRTINKAANIKEVRIGGKVYEVRNGFMKLKDKQQ